MSDTARVWRLDAHVHLHPGNLTPSSLIRLADRACRAEVGSTGVLERLAWCLADMPNVETFCTVRDPAFVRGLAADGATLEASTSGLLTIRSPRWELHLVEGEQRVSTDGLEVLVVGGKLQTDERESIDRLVARVLEKGLLPIVPWGVGKWLGRRGQLVSELVADESLQGRLALADSGTRPRFWPIPPQLAQARESGVAVLHGSDSLNVGRDQRRTGQFGVLVPVSTDRGALADLRACVARGAAPTPVGSPITAWQFGRSQAMLRLQRR